MLFPIGEAAHEIGQRQRGLDLDGVRGGALGLFKRGQSIFAPAVHRLEYIGPGQHGIRRGERVIQLNRFFEICARLQGFCTTLEAVEVMHAEQ